MEYLHSVIVAIDHEDFFCLLIHTDTTWLSKMILPFAFFTRCSENSNVIVHDCVHKSKNKSLFLLQISIILSKHFDYR